MEERGRFEGRGESEGMRAGEVERERLVESVSRTRLSHTFSLESRSVGDSEQTHLSSLVLLHLTLLLDLWVDQFCPFFDEFD